MKNTSLALATKPNLIPKPTKGEIIEAMVKRAVSKIEAENADRKKKREAILVKIKKVSQKLAKRLEFSVSLCVNSRNPHVYLSHDNVTSPELDKLLAEYKACEHVSADLKKLREQIRNEINGAMKPDPDRLLKDPSTVSAIDAQLAAWGIK